MNGGGWRRFQRAQHQALASDTSHAFIDNRHTTSSFHTYNNAFQVVVFRHDLGAVVQGNSRFATNAWYEGYSSRENASIGCLATSLIGTSRSRANRCFL